MPITSIALLLLRFILPFFYFKFPFQASWFNFLLDTIDGDIIMGGGLAMATYIKIDKIADFLAYIAMFLVGRKWQIGKTIKWLFVYRLVGTVFYAATDNDLVFMLFLNLLEPIFMVFSLLLFINKEKAYSRYKNHIVPIWAFILAYKVFNEYTLHLGHIDVSGMLFGFNN